MMIKNRQIYIYTAFFLLLVVAIAIYQVSRPASDSDKRAKLVEFCELSKLAYNNLKPGEYISETIASRVNDCLYIDYDIPLYKPNAVLEFEAKIGTTTYKGKCSGSTGINFCAKHSKGKRIIFCPSKIVLGSNIEIDGEKYECADTSKTDEFLIYCGLDSSCNQKTRTIKVKAFTLKEKTHEG